MWPVSINRDNESMNVRPKIVHLRLFFQDSAVHGVYSKRMTSYLLVEKCRISGILYLQLFIKYQGVKEFHMLARIGCL